MELTNQQKSYLVELYFSIKPTCERSLRRAFQEKFPEVDFSMRLVRRLAKKFQSSGSICNVKPSGRPRSVRSSENVDKVKREMIKQPENSVRNMQLTLRKQGIDISVASVGRIMKDSKFKGYKFDFGQELNELDFPQRVVFCNWFIHHCSTDLTFLTSLWMSDESYFYLSPKFNNHNHRYWSISKPNYKIATPQYPQSLHVWCAMSSKGIIGPFFVRNSHLNSEKYCAILKDQFFLMLDEYRVDMTSKF